MHVVTEKNGITRTFANAHRSKCSGRDVLGSSSVDYSVFTIAIFMTRLVLKPSFSYTRIAPTFSERT